MRHANTRLAAVAVIALGACSTAAVLPRSQAPTPEAWVAVAEDVGADRARLKAGQALASPEADGVAGDGRYVGDLDRMIVAYGGLDRAREVLGEMCASQAPGVIFTVYRPGDLQRDGWCTARYREVDEVKAIRVKPQR